MRFQVTVGMMARQYYRSLQHNLSRSFDSVGTGHASRAAAQVGYRVGYARQGLCYREPTPRSYDHPSPSFGSQGNISMLFAIGFCSCSISTSIHIQYIGIYSLSKTPLAYLQ